MRSLKKQLHNKGFFLKVLAVMCLMAMLCGCENAQLGQDTPEALQYMPQISITNADAQTTVENATAIDIGQADSVCSITEPGNYVLSGSLRGKIEINAQDQIVHLFLNGVEVESVTGPALQIVSAGKVFITLCTNTVNTFRDSAYYPPDTQVDACIYSECDLTINGTGSLNVSGYYKDAVHAKDVLKILGGNVFVQAKQDGIQGNDGIAVTCQSLAVQSERHGLYTTKAGKTAKGNIEIYGGDHSVIAGGYAISSAADLYVDQCSLYAMGVLDTYKVAGQSFVAEGSDA